MVFTMFRFVSIFVFGLMAVSAPVSAQDLPAAQSRANSVVQASGDTQRTDVTHDALRLTPDKSEIIDMPRNIGRVIIGNDSHINVLVDTPRRIVVVPHEPGATHFSVLDERGNNMMVRHVIVASPKSDYVRIRRNCGSAGAGCEPTSVYYCPDMCHSISVGGNPSGGAGPATISGGGVGGNGTNIGNLPPVSGTQFTVPDGQ